MARQPGSSGPGGRAPAHPLVLIGTNVVLGFSFQRFQRKKGHCTSLAMRAGSGHARRERPRSQTAATRRERPRGQTAATPASTAHPPASTTNRAGAASGANIADFGGCQAGATRGHTANFQTLEPQSRTRHICGHLKPRALGDVVTSDGGAGTHQGAVTGSWATTLKDQACHRQRLHSST